MPMSIAIFDPFNHSPGLSLLFPEADYYVYPPDSQIHFRATRHMFPHEFAQTYGFHYNPAWKSISSQRYDSLFLVLPLLDCLPSDEWYSKPDAVRMFRLIKELLSSNTFGKVCLFDTYDYDYDPSLLFPECKIDIFFKRNMNRSKPYNQNVFPFPFVIFTVPCPLFMMLTYERNTYTSERKDGIFWSGSTYSHDQRYTIHGVEHHVTRNREEQFKQIETYLSCYSGLPHNTFLQKLSTYKYGLDLEGVGDPNARTFEILLSGSLRIFNNTDLLWPFPESFPEVCSFKSKEDFDTKMQAMAGHYSSALEHQEYIVKKYINKEWLRSYTVNLINKMPPERGLPFIY